MIWSNEMLAAKIQEARERTEAPNLPRVTPPPAAPITPWAPDPVSLAEGLRRIRAKVGAGRLMYFALHETFQGEDVNRVEDLLVRAMPECHEQFWDWVESKDRQPWDILRALDVAILKAKKLS